MRRSEERRTAAPPCNKGRAGQVRAGGEAETWEDQRQGGGSTGASGGTGARAAGGSGAAGPGAAQTGGTGAAGAGGAAGVGAGDPEAGDTGAGGAGPGGAVCAGSGDTGRPRLYFVPLIQQVLRLPSSTRLTPPLLCPQPDQSQPPLQPASSLPAPSPYNEHTGGLTERRAPVSHPASPVRVVRTGRRVPRRRPPPVPGTHHMALCPSSVPERVPLPSPLVSSLADGPDPESDLVRAASPIVPRLLTTVVTDPSFESAAASALVAELVNFAAAYRLDYAASLVAESESDCPPSIEGECALDTDVLEDRHKDFECFATAVPHLLSMLIAPEGDPDAPDILTPRSYAEAITGPYSSQWQTAMDAEMASWKSTGTYVDAVPPLGANIGSLHEEIWLRRPPGFTGSFPAGTQWSLRRPVYGLCQVPREWHNTLRTMLAALGFAPLTPDPLLFLHTDTSLPPFYVLVYVDDLDFATADTEALALVKSELQKRHTCTDLGELRIYLGLQITRDRARRTITLTQSHMVHQVLLRFGFRYSSPHSTPLPTGHSLSAPPSDESVEPSGLYPELMGYLMYLMTCTRPDLAYPLSILARYIAPMRHRPEGVALLVQYFGHGARAWRMGSCCEAEIYAGAMAAEELRWLNYLLTDLGEQPRSSPVLYVDNKAMIALCQEHRLEHRMKHIALRYFLAQEL
ncbi:unnamed protein product [Closterium sp. NIES-54]